MWCSQKKGMFIAYCSVQKHYIFKNVHTLIKKYFTAKNNSLLLGKNAEHSVSGTLFWWRVLS